MEDCRKPITETLRQKNHKISLEDYLDFFSSNKQLCLTVSYLHQIIRMHGYMKIKGQKNVLMDAVSTIDLVNLSRSTLNESVSSSASIPLEDVISDLKVIDWQECCVTSLLTSSSWNQSDSDPSPDYQERIYASEMSEKKLRSIMECLDRTEVTDGVSSSCASKKRGSELGPQSKRKKKVA